MHQTFYIDIDEEITSVVEKLRKTEAPEVVLVIPKRALLIQSIVNLKLLRKVADDLGLKISIVTQDKLGKMLIQKAGISVQQKISDSSEESETPGIYKNQPRELKKEIESAELEDSEVYNKKRLEKIGSADYFISSDGADSFSSREDDWSELTAVAENKSIPNKKKEGLSRKKNVSAMDVSIPASRQSAAKGEAFQMANVGTKNTEGINRPVALKSEPFQAGTGRFVSTSSSSLGISGSQNPITKKNSLELSEPTDELGIPFSKNVKSYPPKSSCGYEGGKKGDPRDQQLEKFFYANNFSGRNKDDHADRKEELEGKGGNKFVKTLVIFGAIAFSGALLYVAYLYIPKATIAISAKKDVKSIELKVMGNANSNGIDYDKLMIPVKSMEFDEDIKDTFVATGSQNVSNQKARGKITIYNEFSSSSQPLVATTRFMTEDKKVFRLVQGVTIPGTTKVGNDIKPGVVEAEVIADESGDSYNVGPVNFTIPGFQNSGNEKYAKIYAKSEVAMSGGGSGSAVQKVVSEKDVSDAKDKISLEINNVVKSKVKSSVDPGVMILDDAIVIEEPIYTLSNSAGEVADSFEIKVSAHVRALVFLENDLKKLANSAISKSGNGKINIDTGAVIIDYGKSRVDLDAETIEINMHASNVMQPDIDLENLKKGLLGKSSDELADYLKTYSNIEKAEVEYWPPVFVNKIPLNEKRVDVVLNATMPE